MLEKSKGNVPPEESGERPEGEETKKLSPELRKKVESLRARLAMVEALFKLAPEVAFDEALAELRLKSKEGGVSDEEKKLLDRYFGEIIKLISEYHWRLPKEKLELFKQLCIGLLK